MFKQSRMYSKSECASVCRVKKEVKSEEKVTLQLYRNYSCQQVQQQHKRIVLSSRFPVALSIEHSEYDCDIIQQEPEI